MAGHVAALTLLALTMAGPGDPAGSGAPEAHGTVSRALRLFTAEDLAGHEWTAAHLRGKVVLLDFWATWCAPCLADLPRLKTLRAAYSRDDFEILGISLDAMSRRAFVSWLNRHRIDWPQIHERTAYGGELPRLFGVDRLPRTIVIDRDGRVAAVDVRGEDLARLVELLVTAGISPQATGARAGARAARALR